jgi:hypothetical protein
MQLDLSPADRAWKRLNARGEARIYRGTDHLAVVAWWPRGQTGNPFCQRNFAADTLEEALVRAEEETRPPWMSIETLAYYRQREREKAARKLVTVIADGEFSR